MSFDDALHAGEMLLMDGAMGTELIRAGHVSTRLEQLNCSRPESVLAVHQAYAAAGARCLVTNTFQATPQRYAPVDLRRLFAAALDLARRAAPGAWVLADVGPLAPAVGGDGHAAAAADPILDCCRAADGILLETWSDPGAAVQIAQARRRRGLTLPLLVSFTFRRNQGKLATFCEAAPAECAAALARQGVTALGVNCGVDIGLAELLEIVHAYRAASDLPVFVRPNAGTRDAQGAYPGSPAEMAGWLPELSAAGVCMVGGCCGTTPAHIAALAQRLAAGVS